MNVAFVLFDDLTLLDFVGAYDPITRLHSMGFDRTLTWQLCTRAEREIHDDRGLTVRATEIGESLAAYDLVVVPGGIGAQRLATDSAFVAWLRTAPDRAVLASVCTGALLLGAAGWLRGLRATTHHSAMQDLTAYGAIPVLDRVADEGRVVTAAGVTSGIDLGLHLVERFAGQEVRSRIQQQMEYRTPV